MVPRTDMPRKESPLVVADVLAASVAARHSGAPSKPADKEHSLDAYTSFRSLGS